MCWLTLAECLGTVDGEVCFVPAEVSTSNISENGLILRSIWCSSSYQAFAISDITCRSVILCNPQNQQKHQNFLGFPSWPAAVTLSSDVGVIQVAAPYKSLRAVNCFETAAAWDAKLEERYNLFFFAQL